MPRWVEPRLRRLLGTRRHKVDAVVSNGGGNHYATINQALAAAPPPAADGTPARRYVIHVRSGTYDEIVNITRSDVTLIGDGMGRTVITGNHCNRTGHDVLQSATLSVNGTGFMARDLTIKNTAGVDAGPAVALMNLADSSICYKCEIDGYQDTLNADCNRQFYHTCNISGTVDFVFGYAKAVFQQCNLLVRRPVPDGHCVVTAQGRGGPNDVSGFVFQDSTVAALPGVDLNGVPTYLGRPWKNHSHVVFMNCFLDGIIHPAGWEGWKDYERLGNIFYGEYQNRGDGANTQGRVKWPGFHIIKDAAEAANFTVQRFIQGDGWLPEFGVKYKGGLE
ncbi:pectinesterase/pectinesterase inhibitor PPE8B-like [Setaria italica]|nr:pectinesterase/pectinesterase inhibitor PPE8B-like [Setaria italica]